MPRISVVVATIERWPVVRPCLDRLLPQIAETGGELILADGTPNGDGSPPVGLNHYAAIRTIAVPGASVFALRARGTEAAASALVAFTEDHCIVGERWLAQVLTAHEAHTDADMVSGPVTNGSSDGLVDWANFLMTFAEFMPPPPNRPLKRTPPMSNASFRRSVLLGGVLPEGWLEIVMAPTTLRAGRLHYSQDIVVSHVQPRRLKAALAAHFNNGRACAGLALPHIAASDWLRRVATVPALPWVLYVSVARSLNGRTIPRLARLSMPVVWCLSASHTLGELLGLFLGVGPSAKRLN